MGEKSEGINKYDWWLQSSHGDVRHRIEITINNTVITMYDASWVLEVLGEHFAK